MASMALKIYMQVCLQFIGKNGVEKIEEINLRSKEKEEFKKSVEAVKKLWQAAIKIDPDLNK